MWPVRSASRYDDEEEEEEAEAEEVAELEEAAASVTRARLALGSTSYAPCACGATCCRAAKYGLGLAEVVAEEEEEEETEECACCWRLRALFTRNSGVPRRDHSVVQSTAATSAASSMASYCGCGGD